MKPSTSKSKQQKRNWLELPSDVTANILYRIGMIDILENAKKVCTAWYKICKDPAMWRVINMYNLLNSSLLLSTDELFKRLVDRSQGQLVDITLVDAYINVDLLLYVAQRSSQLKQLKIVSNYGIYHNYRKWSNVLMKFPLLEEISLYSAIISKAEIETIGLHCPMLKTLKVNQRVVRFHVTYTDEYLRSANETAIAIGENLLGLRHLELIGNCMKNEGLQAILDGCRHLETLDLRKCCCLDLKGDLGKRCSKKIKHLKLPHDSLEGYPYNYEEDDAECYLNDSPELYDGYISQ